MHIILLLIVFHVNLAQGLYYQFLKDDYARASVHLLWSVLTAVLFLLTQR